MNLWLIGVLMGDLRPSAGNSGESDADMQLPETNVAQQIVTKTNRPAVPPGQAEFAQTTNVVFSVKGVSRNGSKSAVTIQTGKRTYTIMLGESALTQTPDGPVSVRFKELGDGWVVLTIDGKETKLLFH
jgi:hypothetical protein